MLLNKYISCEPHDFTDAFLLKIHYNSMPVSHRFVYSHGFIHVFVFDKLLAHVEACVNIPVSLFVKFRRRADLTFNTSAMRKKQVNRFSFSCKDMYLITIYQKITHFFILLSSKLCFSVQKKVILRLQKSPSF